MLVKCLLYMQYIIHIMHKWYIGHQSLGDQTLSGRNGCLTPSHSIPSFRIQFFWIGRLVLCLSFYFWVDCNQDKRPCIHLVDYNQDSKPCKIQFIKLVFIFTQSITMKHFNHVNLYLVFSYFFIFKKKKKWQLHTTYSKKRGNLKSTQISFLRALQFWRSLTPILKRN